MGLIWEPPLFFRNNSLRTSRVCLTPTSEWLSRSSLSKVLASRWLNHKTKLWVYFRKPSSSRLRCSRNSPSSQRPSPIPFKPRIRFSTITMTLSVTSTRILRNANSKTQSPLFRGVPSFSRESWHVVVSMANWEYLRLWWILTRSSLFKNSLWKWNQPMPSLRHLDNQPSKFAQFQPSIGKLMAKLYLRPAETAQLRPLT